MKDLNNEAFISLFKEAYKKCFGFDLKDLLSETESKLFSNKIYEETGLVIGAKSIKNYSLYITRSLETKQENPSVATLDTFARYVLKAPYTDEVKRKATEKHYPYWFEYRNTFTPAKSEKAVGTNLAENQTGKEKERNKKPVFFTAIAVLLISLVFLARHFLTITTNESFSDNFNTVHDDSLKKQGWMVQEKDELWWSRRNQIPSHLTLFTLPGDNWADSANNKPVIKNLLLRKITSDCFTAEIHFDDFVPARRWQQAGILLLEDTAFSGKSVRVSIAFNDFFGGYNKPKEIILQAISSRENNLYNPEEIVHMPIFSIEPGQEALVATNLRKSAIKIEKNGRHFRFLYATGQADNFAFKEALTKDLEIQPKYIGIFALQGFVNNTNYIPVHVKAFTLTNTSCSE